MAKIESSIIPSRNESVLVIDRGNSIEKIWSDGKTRMVTQKSWYDEERIALILSDEQIEHPDPFY